MPFVAFQAFSWAASSLRPHTSRFDASALVAKHPTNKRTASEMRTVVPCPPSISVFSPEVDLDEPERASGLLSIAIRVQDTVSEVGSPRT